MVAEHEPDSDRSAVNSGMCVLYCMYVSPGQHTTQSGMGSTPQAVVKVELGRLNWAEEIRRKAPPFSGCRYGKFASLQGYRIQIFC